MSDGEVIYREGPFTLVKYRNFNESIVRLFDETIWGSEGAQYEHKKTKEQLDRIARPLLVEVRKDGKLGGACVFIEREVKSGDLRHLSYFIRYLVGRESFRGKGWMKKYAARTMELVRSFSNEPTVFIGIVEKANQRSFKLVESVDFSPVSTVRTVSFSRFYPRHDKSVRLLREDERPLIKKELESMYENYSLWHTENLFKGWDYYVLEEDGRIMAGLQVSRGHWVVRNLPGLGGKLLVRVLPYVPLFRKIFNPSQFRFAAFDYIYFRKEDPAAVERLFSAVLRKLSLNTGLFWFDSRSPHLQEMLVAINPGVLHRFASGNDSYFMLGFENMDAGMKARLSKLPAFQSSGDFI